MRPIVKKQEEEEGEEGGRTRWTGMGEKDHNYRESGSPGFEE